jgi:rare lipoprotein A
MISRNLMLAAAMIWLYDPHAALAQSQQGAGCAGQLVVATWYASGRHTASGERFNPNGHTAAHRTMAFGSRVSVTNPRNGKSIVVVINDRGPFTRGVTLDLARGAARAIGMGDRQRVCMSSA